MTIEDNKAVVRRFWEQAFDSGDLELVDKLFTSDHALRYPGLGEEGGGRDAMKTLVGVFRSVSPDFHINVQDEIAEEDRVVVRWAGSGSVREEIAAEAGDKVRVSGIAISRVGRGRIEETWLRFTAHPDGARPQVPREGILERVGLNISDPAVLGGRLICLIIPRACEPDGERHPEDPMGPLGLTRPDG